MAARASVRRSMPNRLAAQQDLTKQLAEAVTRFHVAEQAVKNYEEGILPDAMRTSPNEIELIATPEVLSDKRPATSRRPENVVTTRPRTMPVATILREHHTSKRQSPRRA